MKLFKYEDYKVWVSEEALTLKPFRLIWQRDRSMSKLRAIQELSYIYFMVDPRSDYQYIADEEDRSTAIKDGEGLDSEWKPDKLVKDAMEFYKSFKSSAALLLEDTRIAIDKLRTYIKELDLAAVDDKGKPLYTLSNYTQTIKIIPQLIKDLNEAERAINQEMAESGGEARGQSEKALFEDLGDMEL